MSVNATDTLFLDATPCYSSPCYANLVTSRDEWGKPVVATFDPVPA